MTDRNNDDMQSNTGYSQNNGFNYIQNPYTQSNKKKYTTIIVTVIIIVALLSCGGLFAVLWGITDYKGGILFRKDTQDNNDYTYEEDNLADNNVSDNTDRYNESNTYDNDTQRDNSNNDAIENIGTTSEKLNLLHLDSYIPLDISITDLYIIDNYDFIITAVITNNSKYDNVEVVLRDSYNEDDRIYFSEFEEPYTQILDSGETRKVRYEIYSYSDENDNKIDLRDKGSIDLTATIYCEQEVDWEDGDYHYLEVEGGTVYWDMAGTLSAVESMDTWGYSSTFDIKQGSPINN